MILQMKNIMKNMTLKRFVALAALLLCSVSFVLAQGPVKVTGKVVDNMGEPMIGVSILEKGTTNGVITDIDGNYSLSVNQSATLVFSYVGYITQELAAVSGTLNVTLKEDTETLEEVVVVGYGVQKKSDLTGAISSVKTEDIENRTITRAEQALQGKTAGVQLVSTSSQPGAAPSIRIRGYSSNGTSDPLYVVDGLIVSDLSSIDPNNIKSMEVLKDAASAAIYGAQAGNGVVLITTKTGNKGSSSITYDFQYSINSLANRPKLINSQESLSQQKEVSNTFTDQDIQNLIDSGIWDGQSTTDWYDVAFTNSAMSRHSVNLQGANDNGSFYLSLSNLYNNGILRGNYDTYKRLSIMLNADYNIKKWLKVGVTANYNKYTTRPISDGSSNSSYGSMISRIMTLKPYWQSTYSPDALPSQMQGLLDSGYVLFTDNKGDYYMTLGDGESQHPQVALRSSIKKQFGNSLSGTLYANFTPFKGFTFTTRLGYRESNDNYYQYDNLYYGSSSISNKDQNGAQRSNTSVTYYQWENFANYATTIADNHNLSAMLGMSFAETNTTYVMAGVDQVAKDNPLFWDVSYPSGTASKTVAGYDNLGRKLSYFGRIGYDYKSRYMAQFSMRADAADSSILPMNNRWGYFPSVSAGWVLSNEQFFQNINRTPITFVKLRASWGQNGSTSSLGNYSYSNSLTSNSIGYSYYTTQLIYAALARPNQVANNELKWETSEQLDLGFDVRAFNDRLTLGFDWYKKTTKDLIVSSITIPYEVGNSSAPLNAGNVENRGFEIELGWKDKPNKDFSYSINANLATLKNEVTYLDSRVSNGRIEGDTRIAGYGSITAFEVGHPVWYFRGYEVDHLDEKGAPVYVDQNNSGSIDDEDRVEIGKPMPDFTFGLTASLNYKNFDFLVFGSGSIGNDAFMAYEYHDISYTLKELYDQRWTADGSTNRKYAAPTQTGVDKYAMSDAYVFDASFFRIKQIQLGYTFPQTLTKKAFIDKCRLYVSLDDFFTFTSYPGLDPEVSASATSGMGVDFGNYPMTKKVVFGLSVTF